MAFDDERFFFAARNRRRAVATPYADICEFRFYGLVIVIHFDKANPSGVVLA